MSRYSLLTVYENVKWFTSSRPPLIILSLCLGFGIMILVSVAYYVQLSQYKKLDISQDWNLFLESFSKLDFCVDNGTSAALSTSDPLSTRSDTTQSISTSSSVIHEATRNYSVKMLLEVEPTIDFINIPHNLTFLTGSVKGFELGLTGKAAEKDISLAVQLPFEWNNTRCLFSSACDIVRIYTCVYIVAPDLVFPSSRSPDRCELLNDTGVEYHAQFRTREQQFDAESGCQGRTMLHARYRLDPKLTVLLVLSDRSLVNLHLLHSSYFVFVMTVTILFYVLLRSLPVRFKLR